MPFVSSEQLLERFYTKFVVDDILGCWLWKAAKAPGGYGEFWDGFKVRKAHRWSYENFRKTIPKGLCLDHLCRMTNCVNPEHLEAVTQRENIRRGNAPAALQMRQTHCIRGHSLSGYTVYIDPRKRRVCKLCRRESDCKRYRKNSNAN